MVQRCKASSKGKVVLAIQDGSEINLSNHKNRIEHDASLGRINDHYDGIGFKLHPSFVVNAHTFYPYGYSSIHIQTGPYKKEAIAEYAHKRLDISEKETQVWLDANEDTYKSLDNAQSVIIVQDRSGDFYEQFANPQKENFFFQVKHRSAPIPLKNQSCPGHFGYWHVWVAGRVTPLNENQALQH